MSLFSFLFNNSLSDDKRKAATFDEMLEKSKKAFKERFEEFEQKRTELNEACDAVLYQNDSKKLVEYSGKFCNNWFGVLLCDDDVKKAWQAFVDSVAHYKRKENDELSAAEDRLIAYSEDYAKDFALLKTFMKITDEEAKNEEAKNEEER